MAFQSQNSLSKTCKKLSKRGIKHHQLIGKGIQFDTFNEFKKKYLLKTEYFLNKFGSSLKNFQKFQKDPR